jgi:hypothetical protein
LVSRQYIILYLYNIVYINLAPNIKRVGGVYHRYSVTDKPAPKSRRNLSKSINKRIDRKEKRCVLGYALSVLLLSGVGRELGRGGGVFVRG